MAHNNKGSKIPIPKGSSLRTSVTNPAEKENRTSLQNKQKKDTQIDSSKSNASSKGSASKSNEKTEEDHKFKIPTGPSSKRVSNNNVNNNNNLSNKRKNQKGSKKHIPKRTVSTPSSSDSSSARQLSRYPSLSQISDPFQPVKEIPRTPLKKYGSVADYKEMHLDSDTCDTSDTSDTILNKETKDSGDTKPNDSTTSENNNNESNGNFSDISYTKIKGDDRVVVVLDDAYFRVNKNAENDGKLIKGEELNRQVNESLQEVEKSEKFPNVQNSNLGDVVNIEIQKETKSESVQVEKEEVKEDIAAMSVEEVAAVEAAASPVVTSEAAIVVLTPVIEELTIDQRPMDEKILEDNKKENLVSEDVMQSINENNSVQVEDDHKDAKDVLTLDDVQVETVEVENEVTNSDSAPAPAEPAAQKIEKVEVTEVTTPKTEEPVEPIKEIVKVVAEVEPQNTSNDKMDNNIESEVVVPQPTETAVQKTDEKVKEKKTKKIKKEKSSKKGKEVEVVEKTQKGESKEVTPVTQVEKEQKTEKQIAIEKLSSGGTFTKYGRKGKPHKRRVWLDTVKNRICWKESDKKDKERAIDVKEIRGVEAGCNTKVFQRFPKICTQRTEFCLSLVATDVKKGKKSKERTLDLEFETKEQRQEWLAAFSSLLT